MILKQCFKFLNTLGLGFQNVGVFLIGQGNQVSGTVIASNAIQMMDYPTFGQTLPMKLLPNQNVLQNNAFNTRPWVLWSAYHNIFPAFIFATLPRWMFPRFSFTPIFHHALIASLATLAAKHFPTINAKIRNMNFGLPTSPASWGLLGARPTTIRALSNQRANHEFSIPYLSGYTNALLFKDVAGALWGMGIGVVIWIALKELGIL